MTKKDKSSLPMDTSRMLVISNMDGIGNKQPDDDGYLDVPNTSIIVDGTQVVKNVGLRVRELPKMVDGSIANGSLFLLPEKAEMSTSESGHTTIIADSLIRIGFDRLYTGGFISYKAYRDLLTRVIKSPDRKNLIKVLDEVSYELLLHTGHALDDQ